MCEQLKTLYENNLLASCHDIASGGMWVTLIEMILGERGLFKVGFDCNLSEYNCLLTTLFSENGGYIIATKDHEKVSHILQQENIKFSKIGKTTHDKTIKFTYKDSVIDFNLDELNRLWNSYNI